VARPRKSPLATLAQGLVAGVIGNAVFTAYQEVTSDSSDEKPRRWSQTPAPAQVGKRIAEGVFEQDVPLAKAGLVGNVMHWLYGSGWGPVYGVIEESVRRPPLSAVALTSTVMVADYTVLPAMGLYEPPWRYPARTLAKDYAVHLVHGAAIAVAYRALDRAFSR
jgi:hypothetical protein